MGMGVVGVTSFSLGECVFLLTTTEMSALLQTIYRAYS